MATRLSLGCPAAFDCDWSHALRAAAYWSSPRSLSCTLPDGLSKSALARGRPRAAPEVYLALAEVRPRPWAAAAADA